MFAVSVVLSRLTSCLLCVTSASCENGFVVWWIKGYLCLVTLGHKLAPSVSVAL